MNDNNNKNKSSKKSFWTSLPGILTAIAALITAICGLIAIFYPPGPDVPEEVIAPEIGYFRANPQAIRSGGDCTLNWAVYDADDVSINPGVGPVDPIDTMQVSPESTTTYTLKAVKDGEIRVSTVTVTVEEADMPIINYFEAGKHTICQGEKCAISWDVEEATEVKIEPGFENLPLRGTRYVTPDETTDYTLTASNEFGDVKNTVRIQVQDPPRIELFEASKTEIKPGDSSVLSWKVVDASEVKIKPGIGSVDPSEGQISVNPAETVIYTLEASNEAGSVEATLKIVVVEEIKLGEILVVSHDTSAVGADVYLNEEYQGKMYQSNSYSLLLITDIPPDEYVVKVKKSGYQDSSVEVEVLPGQRTEAGVDLEPEIIAIYSTGFLEIPQTWTADLDEGEVGPSSGADIWFQAVTATERYVTPRNGAKIAIVGTHSIELEECMDLSLSESSINVNYLPEGTYICVFTNEERYSQFRINEQIGPSPGKLVINYTTWEAV